MGMSLSHLLLVFLTIVVLLIAESSCGSIDAVFYDQCTGESGAVWVTAPASCISLQSQLQPLAATIGCIAPSHASQLSVTVVDSGLMVVGHLWREDNCNSVSSGYRCQCSKSTGEMGMPLDMGEFGSAVVKKDAATVARLLDEACSKWGAIAP
jgi:hypothetical protein